MPPIDFSSLTEEDLNGLSEEEFQALLAEAGGTPGVDPYLPTPPPNGLPEGVSPVNLPGGIAEDQGEIRPAQMSTLDKLLDMGRIAGSAVLPSGLFDWQGMSERWADDEMAKKLASERAKERFGTSSTLLANALDSATKLPETMGDVLAFMPLGAGEKLATSVGLKALKPVVSTGIDALLSSVLDKGGDITSDLLRGNPVQPLDSAARDVAIQTGAGALLTPLIKASGWAGNRMTGYMSKLTNPEYNAVHGLDTDFFPKSGIESQGLGEVLPRLKAQSSTFANIDNLLKQDEPLVAVSKSIDDELGVVAKGLTDDASKATYRIGDAWGEAPRMPLAAQESQAGRIVTKEWDRAAKNTLGKDYDVYKLAERKLASADRALTAADLERKRTGVWPKGYYQLVDEKNSIGKIVSDFESQISNSTDSVANLRQQRVSLDDLGRFEQGPAESPVYKQIASTVRDTEEKAIRSSLGNDAADAYLAGKQRESDLLTVAGGARRGAELEKGQLPQASGIAGQAGTGGTKWYLQLRDMITGTPAERRATQLRRAFAPSSLDTLLSKAGEKGGEAIDFLSNNLGRPQIGSTIYGLQESQEPNDVRLPGVQSYAGTSQYFSQPKEGFTIPRNLSQIDMNSLAMFVAAYAPPEQAGPLIMQARRLQMTGDKMQLGQYITQVARALPNIPLQVGVVTGLSSEFDLGDGVARLLDPTDRAEWERRIEASNLDSINKAVRIKNLHSNFQAHRMDEQLNPSLLPQPDPVSIGMKRVMETHKFSPRAPTPLGSRKIEE